MKAIEDLHIRVCDKNLFLPLARRLARDVKKVTYWTNCDRDFPTLLDAVGDGFPDIERVPCYLEGIDEVDCCVFPDVGMANIQACISDCGIPVWGSRGGCELETSRGLFLDTLKDLGLEVPAYAKIKGITNLKLHLRDLEDKWIKISGNRGDWETFHWRSWEEDENELDAKAARLGPFRELITFYVLDPIDADVEDGCDAYNIDGQFPSLVIHGMEAKDKAYVGTFQEFAALPEELRHINEAFGQLLGEYGYRNFFSIEVRITKSGEAYFIDPTCRCGSPPSQVQAEMIGNLAEVIWRGAQGELVDPEPAAKFGVQAICKIPRREEGNWSYVRVDDELDRWLKTSGTMFHDGMVCFPPDPKEEHCQSWLTGIGDTFAEAIKHLQHNIKLLPCGCECDATQLCELLKEVEESEKQGMEFSDQPIPKPETALN
jgi:hypothetical protein